MMNKSMIMTRAWAIAKDASKKSGYSAKEYFAISLRMAWAEAKAKEVKAMEQKQHSPLTTGDSVKVSAWYRFSDWSDYAYDAKFDEASGELIVDYAQDKEWENKMSARSSGRKYVDITVKNGFVNGKAVNVDLSCESISGISVKFSKLDKETTDLFMSFGFRYNSKSGKWEKGYVGYSIDGDTVIVGSNLPEDLSMYTTVKGNTYDFRTEIKSAGFKWDGQSKAWTKKATHSMAQEEATVEKEEHFATLPEIEAVSDKQREYAEDIRKNYLEKVKSALAEVKPTQATCEREVYGHGVMDGFLNSKFYVLFTVFAREMSDWSSNKELFKFQTRLEVKEAIRNLYDVHKKYSGVEEYNAYCKEVTEKAVKITLEAFENAVTASTKAKAWINEYKSVLYK